jgi:hypothetical protein
MVDEQKQVDGNKKIRKFLTQEQQVLMSVDAESVTLEIEAEREAAKRRRAVTKVITYRLPYMTMPKKHLDITFYVLFAVIVVFALA